MAGGLIDPNLSYAWTSQQAAGSTNLYGQAGLGYGTNAPVATPVPAFGAAPNNGQGGGLALSNDGLWQYPGNANAQALTNAGYADQYPLFLGQLTSTTQPPAPALTLATRISNPTGLGATVTIGAGTGSVTGVYVGPNGVGGTGTTNLTQVGSAAGTYTVPPAGVIYVTGTTAPVWTWITQN
jgi:hypothetical protein